MSDEIDRIAVLAWSAFAGFQIGTAIRDGLKWAFDTWRNRARCKDCDHCRLIKGETRNGWQLVIPKQLCWQDGSLGTYHSYARLRLKTTREDHPSVVCGFNLPFRRRAAENRSILQYRRFSMISPEVNATLFKIVYNNSQWRPQCFQNFGCRGILAAFRRFVGGTPAGTHRIVIGHAFTRRQPSWFDIQAPTETAKPITVYYDNVPRDRLMVLFWDRLPKHQVDMDMDEDFVMWQFEFHLAAYECDQTAMGQQKPTPAISWETLSIPGGVRNAVAARLVANEEVLITLFDDTNHQFLESCLLVTFDNEKRWRVETYRVWFASMQKTPVGARLMAAGRSLNKLRNLEWLGLQICDRYAVSWSRRCGLFCRWCEPPPLKFLAAASLVRANPGLSRDQLNDAVGFDVFDTIPDEKGEGDAPITYW